MLLIALGSVLFEIAALVAVLMGFIPVVVRSLQKISLVSIFSVKANHKA